MRRNSVNSGVDAGGGDALPVWPATFPVHAVDQDGRGSRRTVRNTVPGTRCHSSPVVIRSLSLFGVTILLLFLQPVGARPKSNIDSSAMSRAVDFLTKFGYLHETNLETGNLRTEEQLRESIREMQRFGGLRDTGIIDEETIELMNRKRCGLPDLVGTGERMKRYALQGSKWDKTDLTWSIGYPTDKLSYNEIRQQIHLALKVWSDASKLKFTEVQRKEDADIIVSFNRGIHGDGYAFDGPGLVLAHAFFPGPDLGGDTHFDEEENWRSNEVDPNDGEGISLFAVAAHEFGHSLGLSHSRDQTALMFPYYQAAGPEFTLPDDDRMGIEQLYGPKYKYEWATLPGFYTRPPRPTPTTPSPPRRPEIPEERPSQKPPRPPKTPPPSKAPPEPADKPDTCDTSYDAISIIRRELFIFKDSYFWRLDSRGLQPHYPANISIFWSSLPKHFKKVDAVYERPKDRKIVFFIGKEYWMFDATNLLPGYPKPLTRLGLPADLDHIDAAMVWGHNGKTYFFSGKQYWRYDETDGRVELDYPRDMSMWKGVPYKIDAAFQWTDGRTYFFKDKVFWKFNDQRMQVESKMPSLSAPFWMACPVKPPLTTRKSPEVNHPLVDERYQSSKSSSDLLPHLLSIVSLLITTYVVYLF